MAKKSKVKTKSLKTWTTAKLLVVEKYRTNGTFPFFEQNIERWKLPATAQRVFGFELTPQDNDPHHQRIRELLAEGHVVCVEILKN